MMATPKKELNHAECVERELAEWKTIFSLSQKAYGWRIDGYKGKQKLVYIPDMIEGTMVCFFGEKFSGDFAAICVKRLWDKLAKNQALMKIRVNTAVMFLTHPEAFPGDCSEHVRSFIHNKANGKDIINLILQLDDAAALAAYLDASGKVFTLKEVNALLEASTDAVSIRSFLLDWKQKHYSPKQQEKLDERTNNIELGLQDRTVAEWKKLWKWSKHQDGSLYLDKYIGDEESPSIPSKIENSIVFGAWSGAFSGCSSIKNVIIPDGWERIDLWVFRDCKNLTNIEIPERVKTIEYQAFAGCSSLKTLTIPASVTSIGKEAFKDCGSLTSIEIPKGVTDISDGLFSGCSSLTKVTLPSGITCIGRAAFEGCNSLKSVTFPDSLARIEDNAFTDCSALRNVSLPYNVTSIGSSVFLRTAFYNDKSQWDNGALYLNNCLIDFRSSLTDIYEIKPGTRCIGGMAFFCSSLTRVIIPESVISIGSSAFEKCRGLTSVTIPDGVTSIGYRAFEDCSRLTSVAIPASVISIGNCAFRGCPSLTIHAPAGSYAEQYAKENNIPFVAD